MYEVRSTRTCSVIASRHSEGVAPIWLLFCSLHVHAIFLRLHERPQNLCGALPGGRVSSRHFWAFAKECAAFVADGDRQTVRRALQVAQLQAEVVAIAEDPVAAGQRCTPLLRGAARILGPANIPGEALPARPTVAAQKVFSKNVVAGDATTSGNNRKDCEMSQEEAAAIACGKAPAHIGDAHHRRALGVCCIEPRAGERQVALRQVPGPEQLLTGQTGELNPPSCARSVKAAKSSDKPIELRMRLEA